LLPSADFYAATDAEVLGQTVSNSGNLPQTADLTAATATSSGQASARAGLSLGATASLSGSGGAAAGHARVINTFEVLPGPGFTGSTARVDISYILDGSLSVSGIPSPAGVNNANVGFALLTSGFFPDAASSDQVNYFQALDVPGDAFVSVAGVLTGTVNVHTLATPATPFLDIRLNAVVGSDANAFNSTGQMSVDFGNTFSFGVTSPDNVQIIWASDSFSSSPPTVTAVPEPAGLGFAAAALGCLALQRRGKRQNNKPRPHARAGHC